MGERVILEMQDKMAQMVFLDLLDPPGQPRCLLMKPIKDTSPPTMEAKQRLPTDHSIYRLKWAPWDLVVLPDPQEQPARKAWRVLVANLVKLDLLVHQATEASRGHLVQRVLRVTPDATANRVQ